VQYPVIFAVLLRLNRCNSFGRNHAIVLEKRRRKSEDRRFARFADLQVWYFSGTFQQR